MVGCHGTDKSFGLRGPEIFKIKGKNETINQIAEAIRRCYSHMISVQVDAYQDV